MSQITSFNTFHPLFLLTPTSLPPAAHQDRLRALALHSARHPHAALVVLGRWALEPRLVTELTSGGEQGRAGTVPAHVVFLKPYSGQWVAPEVRAREVRFAALGGVARGEVGMRRGRGRWGPARVDPNVVSR